MKNIDEKKLKVLHITAVRQLSSGQRKQLNDEYNASKDICNIDWTTLAIHTYSPVELFEKRVPLVFRSMFLRNLYTWYIVIKLKNDFDIVLCRHMTFDPFSLLFAPLVKNRVSVHHAKEVEELILIRKGITGKLASILEKTTGKFAVKRTLGILGVTSEIARYEALTRAPHKPYDVYPNGVSLEKISLAQDQRIQQEVNAIFICGTFSEWHGLDLLIRAVDESNNDDVLMSLKIHLIGKLTTQQQQDIKASNNRRKVFNSYGTLNIEKYKEVVEKCDIGIGSLAMNRKNLTEGATLKVRELLGMGIPIYSGHIDTALSEDFIFYRHEENVNIDDLIEFAKNMKNYSRIEVREAAAPFIDKTLILESMDKKLQRFLKV